MEKISGSVEKDVKNYRCLKVRLSKILIFVAGKKFVCFLFLRLSRETRINMQHGGGVFGALSWGPGSNSDKV